jgi:hypothetical protein
VLAAVQDGTSGTDEVDVPPALEAVAEQLLAEAKAGPQNRDTALTLLAADTLITFACEAIAERDPGALADLR